jgi:hypothetical protein
MEKDFAQIDHAPGSVNSKPVYTYCVWWTKYRDEEHCILNGVERKNMKAAIYRRYGSPESFSSRTWRNRLYGR